MSNPHRIFITVKDIQVLTGLSYRQSCKEYNYSLKLLNKAAKSIKQRDEQGRIHYTRAQRLTIQEYAKINDISVDEIRTALAAAKLL